jgi:hypothetical protein
MKDKLPDVGNVYEGKGGQVRDSVEFVLQNFTEMNKLWVRLQNAQVIHIYTHIHTCIHIHTYTYLYVHVHTTHLYVYTLTPIHTSNYASDS